MTIDASADPRPASPDTDRMDARDAAWPQRPALLAGLAAMAGAVAGALGELENFAHGPALIALIVTAAISFALTAERRYLGWAAGFALAWGAVVALVAHQNLSYTSGRSVLEWPLWSALLAVAIAAPFFQSWRDADGGERRWWRLAYARLHLHAWTNAVIGGAALAFVGLSWLLAWLVAEMFDLIGLKLLEDLLGQSWFAVALTGGAFGGAVGILRERDAVAAAMQRVVTVVLGVLAPVLAAALTLFLLALIGTGLDPLWRSGFSTAALMLGVAAFCVLLVNAVIGNDAAEAARHAALRVAAAVLAAAVLPLSAIAVTAMTLRIGEYGWTPDRIWGLIAALVAAGYGLAGAWAVARGRKDFADHLRPMQQKLALGLMGLALFLALPVLDFGALSARDQLARLAAGRVSADAFDYRAMAFEFGPAGRRGLVSLRDGDNPIAALKAKQALAANHRYDIEFADSGGAETLPIAERVQLPDGAPPLPVEALDLLNARGLCGSLCAVRWLDGDSLAAIGLDGQAAVLWRKESAWRIQIMRVNDPINLGTLTVETRAVTRRQLVINGQPVGEPFE